MWLGMLDSSYYVGFKFNGETDAEKSGSDNFSSF